MKHRNSWLMVLFVVTGVILGGLIGSFFHKTVPFLNYGPEPLGFRNIEINLGILYFQITLLLKINISSLVGLLIGVVIYKRL